MSKPETKREAERLCPRCELPLRGKRTAVADGAPYAGMRLDAACIAEMEQQTVPEEEGTMSPTIYALRSEP